MIIVLAFIILQKNLNQAFEVSKNIFCSLDESNGVFEQNFRLPTSVRPSTYRISYVFDEEMNFFSGISDIDIQITNKTNKIILHSDRNTITSVSIFKFGDQNQNESSYIEISEICFREDVQIIILKLNREMKIGENATLSIMFSGNISNYLNGIYSSFYTTKANETKF